LKNYGFIFKIKDPDDIDDLKNKRVRTAGELIKNQIKISTSDIIKNIKEKIDYFEEQLKKNYRTENSQVKEIISSKILTNNLKNFFTSNQLSQLMEETNPLSEITHKRKISSFGVGAVDRKKANLNIREINNSQYGRICPIETAEGKNAGLILSIAKDIKLNKNGFIESPFY
jgi:DNA-directed RNA polymerase subunit beta